MNFKNKRLYKSKDKMFSGVCGGFADYFEIDPNFVRLLWVAISFASIGIILYVTAMIIMPEPPYDYQ